MSSKRIWALWIRRHLRSLRRDAKNKYQLTLMWPFLWTHSSIFLWRTTVNSTSELSRQHYSKRVQLGKSNFTKDSSQTIDRSKPFWKTSKAKVLSFQDSCRQSNRHQAFVMSKTKKLSRDVQDSSALFLTLTILNYSKICQIWHAIVKNSWISVRVTVKNMPCYCVTFSIILILRMAVSRRSILIKVRIIIITLFTEKPFQMASAGSWQGFAGIQRHERFGILWMQNATTSVELIQKRNRCLDLNQHRPWRLKLLIQYAPWKRSGALSDKRTSGQTFKNLNLQLWLISISPIRTFGNHSWLRRCTKNILEKPKSKMATDKSMPQMWSLRLQDPPFTSLRTRSKSSLLADSKTKE